MRRPSLHVHGHIDQAVATHVDLYRDVDLRSTKSRLRPSPPDSTLLGLLRHGWPPAGAVLLTSQTIIPGCDYSTWHDSRDNTPEPYYCVTELTTPLFTTVDCRPHRSSR